MKIYEDDYIEVYEYNNGTMTIDKHTGMMLSWEGRKVTPKESEEKNEL